MALISHHPRIMVHSMQRIMASTVRLRSMAVILCHPCIRQGRHPQIVLILMATVTPVLLQSSMLTMANTLKATAHMVVCTGILPLRMALRLDIATQPSPTSLLGVLHPSAKGLPSAGGLPSVGGLPIANGLHPPAQPGLASAGELHLRGEVQAPALQRRRLGGGAEIKLKSEL